MEVIISDPSYKFINFDESLNLQDYIHAAHCCIYSMCKTKLFKNYETSALISMQMRFDGCLGFPGGIIDEGTDIIKGLNRELVEEINLKQSFHINKENHLFTHINTGTNKCYHFFIKEVSEEEFKNIEYDVLSAEEYGIETFGLIRVPMFVMQDGVRGLPTFFKNQFAGCARDQLLNFLVLKKLCSLNEVQGFLNETIIK